MTSVEDPVLEQRTTWIKWLRQRDGLAGEKKGAPYELFGVRGHQGLVAMLSLAVRYDRSLPVRAIGNALHLPTLSADFPSVIERRKRFAEENGDISLSTIERLEDKGAVALAEAIEVLRDANAVVREFEEMDYRLAVIYDLMRHYGAPISYQTLGEIRLRLAKLRNEAEESFRNMEA